MNDGTQNASEIVRQHALGGGAFWRVPWQFAIHAIVGTSIFLIIALAAVGLEIAVHKLESYGVGKVVIIGLKAGEYALFAVDLVLFGIFLMRTASRTIKQL